MKIGVISDTHGSVTAWRKALQYFQDTDFIVHCGDVLYHGPRNPLPEGYDPKALAEELNTCRNLIFAKGNCDAEVDQLMLQFPLESPYAHIFTPELRIIAHHGHVWTPETVPGYVKEMHHVVISGHTHVPGVQKTGKLISLNPGSPALPKNEPKIPTVARIEEDRISIINIQSGEVIIKEEI